MPSQLRRFIASIPVIVLLASLSPALAQQKLAAPSRPSQAQLEEHMKDLEARLNDAQQKAASAAMEKDYITRVQKQYETYYEKAFNTQVITVSILALFITIVLAIAAKFGFETFDRRINTALRETSAQLRTEFNQQLRTELDTLRQQNSAQLKALEDALTIRVTEQEQDLKIRSDYQHSFAQALAFAVGGQYGTARNQFRKALMIYKYTKPKQLIEKQTGGAVTAENLFRTFPHEDQDKFGENAKKELADKLYNDLEDELALAAVNLDWLAPLLKERNAAAPPATG
jgi:hypothetical protein